MSENIKKMQEVFNHLDLRAFNHHFDLEMYLSHVVMSIGTDPYYDDPIDWTDPFFGRTYLSQLRTKVYNCLNLINEIDDKLEILRDKDWRKKLNKEKEKKQRIKK